MSVPSKRERVNTGRAVGKSSTSGMTAGGGDWRAQSMARSGGGNQALNRSGRSIASSSRSMASYTSLPDQTSRSFYTRQKQTQGRKDLNDNASDSSGWGGSQSGRTGRTAMQSSRSERLYGSGRSSGGGMEMSKDQEHAHVEHLDRLKRRLDYHDQIHEGKEHLKKEMPDYLKRMVDIDGDGHIDQEEYSLMRELENVTAVDVDGDGIVDEDEIMLAKEMAGKRILAQRFCDKHRGAMWKFSDDFRGTTSRTQVNTIANARNYRGLMGYLKTKERILTLSGSDMTRESLSYPKTHRPVTYRPLNVQPKG